jgi:hypothetical protein
MKKVICAVDQAQRNQGYENFADSSDSEGTPALFA